MDAEQIALRELIQQMLDFARTDATNLARKAGIAPSTLTRFMNKPVKHLLSARTLGKLRRASGLPESTERRGYVVDEPDQVSLLVLWDELSTPEKTAVMRFIAGLRRAGKSSAA